MQRFLVLSTVVLAACAHSVSDQDASNAKIHYDIGIANFTRGDNRPALKDLLRAVELDPELWHAHNALGLVYHAMNQFEDALKHYEIAIELKPKYSEAYNNLGVLYIDMARYDDAIAAFKTALADILYNTPSMAEGNMGWAYYKKGEAEVAERHLKNAVSENPKFCRGYEWLTRIAMDQSRAKDMVTNCQRFRKYCAEDSALAATIPQAYLHEMQYYLAMGHLKLGEREAARRALVECAVVGAEGEFAQRCTQSLQAMQ